MYFFTYLLTLFLSFTLSSSTIEEDLSKTLYTTNYIMSTYPHVSRELAFDGAVSIQKYSQQYNIPQSLIMAVIHVESTFRPTVVSQEGACGLTQVCLRYKSGGNLWWEELNTVGILKEESDIFNVDRNIEAGCYILNHYIQSSKDISEALYRYNGGGERYAGKVLDREKKIIGGLI